MSTCGKTSQNLHATCTLNQKKGHEKKNISANVAAVRPLTMRWAFLINRDIRHYGDSMAEAAVSYGSYLGDAELAGSQLRLHLVHLLGALSPGALQLFAALHHRLHLWLHLADVETGDGELFINETAALLLLRGQKNKETTLLHQTASRKGNASGTDTFTVSFSIWGTRCVTFGVQNRLPRFLTWQLWIHKNLC